MVQNPVADCLAHNVSSAVAHFHHGAMLPRLPWQAYAAGCSDSPACLLQVSAVDPATAACQSS